MSSNNARSRPIYYSQGLTLKLEFAPVKWCEKLLDFNHFYGSSLPNLLQINKGRNIYHGIWGWRSKNPIGQNGKSDDERMTVLFASFYK